MVGAGNKESAGELGGGVLEQEVYSVLCSAGIDLGKAESRCGGLRVHLQLGL